MRRAAVALLLLTGCAGPTTAAAPAPKNEASSAAPRPGALPAHLEKRDGFIPLLWDAEGGRLYLQVSRLGEEFLYQESLAAGLGSNPVGLDRDEIGPTRLVHFERVGPKLLLVEANTRFRGVGATGAEKRSVEESFATSVLWSFKIEPGGLDVDPGGRLRSATVDATDFFVSDIHGVVARLRGAKQGAYELDPARSAVFLDRTRAFPRNSEIEATVTYQTHGDPGPLVAGVAPTPEAVTLRVHHSFVALPGPGFTPRDADPRVGLFEVDLDDFSSPFGGPIEKRWINRHRLVKKDPSATLSEPVAPIVYYLDPGVPEPVRSALLEGASWWSAAFESAGFKDAFQVKLLPADADPLDARYNVISWVHRSTRGWSYGASVVDPRTGEIVKGAVRIGSMRIRQDVLIGRGLVAEAPSEADTALARLDPRTSARLLGLARIRQLAAHEVGHALGLEHNMAASTYGRASVMDYPGPRVKIGDGGALDLSDAYARGVGAYDRLAIRYAYRELPPGADPAAALDADLKASGDPLFVKDSDARPVGGAHPLASTWDDGEDALHGLEHAMEVRKIALDRFGPENLRAREPLASLEEVLLPLYLHHRYELEAALKSLGGLRYRYEIHRGPGEASDPVRIVAPADQRRALDLALATLDPAFLALPERLLSSITPRPLNTSGDHVELFESASAPVFDPISAAMAGVSVTLTALLDPRRCARLVQFHARDPANPGLLEVLGALVARVGPEGAKGRRPLYAPAGARPGLVEAIGRAERGLVVSSLVALASDPEASAEVRADASEALLSLGDRLGAGLTGVADASERASRRAARTDITRFLSRQAEAVHPAPAPEPPPGPPIGD